MDLEIVIRNYNKLDEKGRRAFENLYWLVRTIHQVKQNTQNCKIITMLTGLFINLIFFPTINSVSKIYIFFGSLIIFYLIGWLIGLILIVYHKNGGLGFLRYQFYYVYLCSEPTLLVQTFQFIQANQPELIQNTDREVKKKILSIIRPHTNPFEVAS